MVKTVNKFLPCPPLPPPPTLSAGICDKFPPTVVGVLLQLLPEPPRCPCRTRFVVLQVQLVNEEDESSVLEEFPKPRKPKPSIQSFIIPSQAFILVQPYYIPLCPALNLSRSQWVAAWPSPVSAKLLVCSPARDSEYEVRIRCGPREARFRCYWHRAGEQLPHLILVVCPS